MFCDDECTLFHLMVMVQPCTGLVEMATTITLLSKVKCVHVSYLVNFNEIAPTRVEISSCG